MQGGSAIWKRVGAFSYTRPDMKGEEANGAAALKLITTFLHNSPKLESDRQGFWMLYELLTSALSIRILGDDEPHLLGALLFRVSNHAAAQEVVPLLRLLSAEPVMATQMPPYSGTTGRKGVVGALGNKVGLFKGKAGAGIGDEMAAAIQRLVPSLAVGGVPLWPLYELPTSSPPPPHSWSSAGHTAHGSPSTPCV